MTRRDARWRAAGAMLGSGACAASVMLDGSPLMIVLFPLALLGLVLTINGKRVVTALRAERRGHGHTAAAIHARRVGQRAIAARGAAREREDHPSSRP
jgi:hypothetical protein